jgi:hypothetical protein
MSVRGDLLDEQIIKACNDLIAAQRNSAKFQAEQQTEIRMISKTYQQVRKKWEGQMKPKKNKLDTLRHQEHVSKAFEGESLSPFLLSRLTQLCYHVHHMTRMEASVPSIHEDYRVIVNWIHESWEEMEQENNGMKEEITKVKRETKELREKQAVQIKELIEKHKKERQELLDKLRTKKMDAEQEKADIENEKEDSNENEKTHDLKEAEKEAPKGNQKDASKEEEVSTAIANPQEVR